MLLILPLWAAGCAASRVSGPTTADLALVDDVGAARRMLETARTEVRITRAQPPARRISRLVDLGLLRDAEMLLTESAGARTSDLVLAEAGLRFRQYRFVEARALVDAVLAADPQNRDALLLSLRLGAASGDSERVRYLAATLVTRGSSDGAAATAAAIMGYGALRAGDTDTALEWAARAQAGRRSLADGWVLEAAVRAALGDVEGEEAALRAALSLDPLNVEARHRYGLVGWRRGGAGRVAAAGEQWRLALEIDPLHLPTHALLGGVCALRVPPPGGGAGLAVADDASREGGEAGRVEPADRPDEVQLVGAAAAVQRGSEWYAAAGSEAAALDSALAAFRLAADAVPGDPAAHRGIAAVLRRRSLDALQVGDSLEALARQWPASGAGSLGRVIPRLGEPGRQEMARALSWRLGEMEGFLPLLERLGSRIHLAELDEPLAAVAGMAALPAPTSLGHCGWAPAAAGLATVRMEDAEGAARDGAPEVLHAIVHLVHDGLLTNEQRRRLRELYRQAVIDGRLQDDRSAADEGEYLARGFEAYLGVDLPDVVGSRLPSREGLLQRNPPLVAFIEELVTGAGAAARGDPRFLRSNLAEMYTRLAREERLSRVIGRPGADRAATLLDSALVHDGAYRPALLEYARVEVERGRPDRAEEWLRVAERAGVSDPAILAARADLLGGASGKGGAAYDARASLLLRAVALERDPVTRADHRRALRALQRGAARLPEAIGSVLEYLRDDPPTTPREVELRLEAEAEMMEMWLEAGHDEEGVGFFGERVAASPADPAARALYFDALLMSGDTVAAAASLVEGQRLLRSAGVVHPRIALRSAELAWAAGDTAGAFAGIERVLPVAEGLPLAEGHRLIRLLVSTGQSSEAHRLLALLPLAGEPTALAEAALSRGWITEWRGDTREAERHYREAVALDPYGAEKRVILHRFLVTVGRLAEADQLAAEAAALAIPLGPGFARRIGR